MQPFLIYNGAAFEYFISIAVNAVIKEIVLHDDRIEITYNYTNKKIPDFQHQGFIFYEEYYEMKTVINQYQDASKLLKVSLVI